jgi:hypothetical protein
MVGIVPNVGYCQVAQGNALKRIPANPQIMV